MKTIHTEAYRTFLRRLKEARVASGKTQVQVARSLEKPQSFVSKVERGERRLDPIELKQIADLYGVKLDWLLARTIKGKRNKPRQAGPKKTV